MSLILDLDPATEQKLNSAATKHGTSSTQFAVDAIKQRLSKNAAPSAQRRSIARLLIEINRGMPEEDWARYADLIRKRRKEILNRTEQAELLRLSERLEKLNARRVALVAEL